MWHAAQNASRVLLASMAFTMAFFLTPRAWITGAETPSSSNAVERVPIDSLEDSEPCLWCDDSAVESTPCRDDKAKWLSPEYRESECSGDDDSDSGPTS